jgi:hypothetical protein
MFQNGKRFGRDLADRMAVRMRFQRVTLEQVTLNVAADVAKLANEMVSAGMTRDDVALWVKQVQIGYVERLEEQTHPPSLPQSAGQPGGIGSAAPSN